MNDRIRPRHLHRAVLALAVGSILGCFTAGCHDKAEPGSPPEGSQGGGAVVAANPGEDSAPGAAEPTPVVCGTVEPWDGDGDGVSTATEENNFKAGYLPFNLAGCDTDPSHPVGTFYAGSLDKGVNLTDKGSGYIHLRGGDPVDADDWGSLALVSCIETVGRAWEATGRRINVNDLSQRPGGKFRPHRSHQNGLDADLRYVRKDGQDAPLDLRRNPEAYDPLATQELLRLFLQHCDVSVIFSDTGRLSFGDDELGAGREVLTYAQGHTNHFHLRLNPPPGRSAGLLVLPREGQAQGLPLHSLVVGAPLVGALALAGERGPLTRAFQIAQAPPTRRPVQITQVPPTTFQPQAAPLLVQRSTDDRRTILRGDTATRRATVLYRSPRDVVFELAVSPDNRYTAALESTDGVVEEGEYTVPPRNELVILDGAGQVVRRVAADVQHYRFSPDGQKVAYLTGAYFEGGVGFLPEGVFILDIASGATERVDAEDVYDLDWNAAGGGALMLRALAVAPERRVLRYDARTRRVSAAPSAAFHLSPDGQFFLKQPDELIEEGTCDPGRRKAGDCFQVFDKSTGKPLSAPSQDLGRPVGWAGGEGHLLLLARQEQASREQTVQLGRARVRGRLPAQVTKAESSLWDPATARVVKKIPAAATAVERPGVWISGRNQLLLETVPARATLSKPALERLIVEPVAPPPR